jgi:transposase-like protein
MQTHEDRRSQMLELAREWVESGAKAHAFAQEHGVTPWQLYYWRNRIGSQTRQRRRRRRSRRVTLAPVHVLPTAEGRGGDLEVVLVSGERVTVRNGVSVDLVRAVVAALRAPC